jgi:hypothetical protein
MLEKPPSDAFFGQRLSMQVGCNVEEVEYLAGPIPAIVSA